jgi:hypothetical protein
MNAFGRDRTLIDNVHLIVGFLAHNDRPRAQRLVAQRGAFARGQDARIDARFRP